MQLVNLLGLIKISFLTMQSKSPVYNFTTALAAGDTTPHKFIVYGDMGIDALLSPDGKQTAIRLIEEYRSNHFRHVFHIGDISYAVGYVSSPLFIYWIITQPTSAHSEIACS